METTKRKGEDANNNNIHQYHKESNRPKTGPRKRTISKRKKPNSVGQ